MPATPAQVANDLDAQAKFFDRRDEAISRACRDTARLIRQMIAGETVDGRTYGGLHKRLVDLSLRHRTGPETQISKSLDRGLVILTTLRAGDGS